jgi:GAF domain-containing protein
MAASPWRADDDPIIVEQEALRRVATLVARGAPPGDVFAAVAEEAVRLVHADFATMSSYDPDGSITVVAAWGRAAAGFPVGSRWSFGGQNLHTAVFQTRRPARIDDQPAASGSVAEAARRLGLRAGVGVPVSVEARVWGVLIVGSYTQPPPASTEARLAGFTELAATAIANAQARVELRGFADEQAALRRVATLVAQAAPPGQVLSAVTGEARRLLGAESRWHGPVRRRWLDDGGCDLGQRPPCLLHRVPVEPRRAEHTRDDLPDRPPGADRRPRRSPKPCRRGCP